MSVVKRRKKEVAEAAPEPQSLIGRQPILDRDGQVQAFELLFRPDTANAPTPFDGNHATANVIVTALTDFGLDHLVGPHPAYINFPTDLLHNDAALLLPTDRVVIEILEDVAVDKQLIEAVTGLSRSGYKLALDDFVYHPKWKPLLRVASTIKIDVLAMGIDEVAAHVTKLKRGGVQLLAEKVETREKHLQLMDLGFDLFQGYYYAKPNIVSRDRIPENHLAIARLLAALNDSTASMEDIETVVVEDVSLSYRLLRYINSAFFALPQKVDSIRRALVYFGIDMLRRWASLLVMASVSGKPKVLMQNALVRARMCEALAKCRKLPEPESYFTVGLFSILDTLLDAPMATVIEPLPLSREIVDALVKREGDRGAALECVCAYEECRWADVKFDGVDREEIGKAYLDSIEWAFDAASGL